MHIAHCIVPSNNFKGLVLLTLKLKELRWFWNVGNYLPVDTA